MASQPGLKHAATEPTQLAGKERRTRHSGAAGRAAALRRVPSDSDCSGETGSLSADSGDKPPSTVRAAPPPITRGNTKRSRRRGSEWEVLEGLKDGQRFEKRPEVFNGYLHKKRKWPLKGWHKRYFVVDGGILVYARGPSDVARGRLHGSVDVGLSVISAKQRRRRIDIDADEFIYHLRAKTPELFRAWLNVLKQHRLYRQHLLTFGVRETAPRIHAADNDPIPESASRYTSASSDESFSTLSLSDSESLPRESVYKPLSYTESIMQLLRTNNYTYTIVHNINDITNALEDNVYYYDDIDLKHETNKKYMGSKSDVVVLKSSNEDHSSCMDTENYKLCNKRHDCDMCACLSDLSLRCRCKMHEMPLRNSAMLFEDLLLEDKILKWNESQRYVNDSTVYCLKKNKLDDVTPYYKQDKQFSKSKRHKRNITQHPKDPVHNLSKTKILSTFFKFKTKSQKKQRNLPKTFYKLEPSLKRSKKCTDVPRYCMGFEPFIKVESNRCFLLSDDVIMLDRQTSDIQPDNNSVTQTMKHKSSIQPVTKGFLALPDDVTNLDMQISDTKNGTATRSVTFKTSSIVLNSNDIQIGTSIKQMTSYGLNSSEYKKIADKIYPAMVGLSENEMYDNADDKATELLSKELFKELSKIEGEGKNMHPTIRKILRLIIDKSSSMGVSKPGTTMMVATKSINAQSKHAFQHDRKVSTDSHENVKSFKEASSENESIQSEFWKSIYDKEYMTIEHEINHKIDRLSVIDDEVEYGRKIKLNHEKSDHSDENSEKVLNNFFYTLDNISQAVDTTITLNKSQLSNKHEMQYKVGVSKTNANMKSSYIVAYDPKTKSANIESNVTQMPTERKLTTSLKQNYVYPKSPSECDFSTNEIEANLITSLMGNFAHLENFRHNINVSCSNSKESPEFNYKHTNTNMSNEEIYETSADTVNVFEPDIVTVDSLILYSLKRRNMAKSRATSPIRYISLNDGIERFLRRSQEHLNSKAVYVVPSRSTVGTSCHNYLVTDLKFSKAVLALPINRSECTSISGYRKKSESYCNIKKYSRIVDSDYIEILSKSSTNTEIPLDLEPKSLEPFKRSDHLENIQKGMSIFNSCVSIINEKYQRSGSYYDNIKTKPSTFDESTCANFNSVPKSSNVSSKKSKSPTKNVVLVLYHRTSAKTVSMSNEEKDRLMSKIADLLPPIPNFSNSNHRKEFLNTIGGNNKVYYTQAVEADFKPRETRSAFEYLNTFSSVTDMSDDEIENPLSRRRSEPVCSSGLSSPTTGAVRGPQAGFVSGTPGGRLGSWVIEPGGTLESVSRELGQAQLSVQQLQRLLEALELQQQAHHDTDVSLEGASPNIKKDRRKFGLRKKKSQSSKGGSVDLQLPHHMDGSLSHSALSALTAPPSPGGGASSMPNSAASLPIACAAARPQSLPGTESLGAAGGIMGPASLASLTPDHQIREDFTVLAKDLVSSLKSIVCTLLVERGRVDAEPRATSAAVCALRNNLTSALHQNSELKSRLARIHDASDIADLSIGPNSDVASRQFQPSLSYSSSCVSASEFFDAEEHEEDDPLKQPDVQGGVIELEGDTSSEAGSLSSEEGSASSDNSEGALLESAESATLTQNGLEQVSTSGWTRRKRLPCPRPTPGGPSLWNLLYKNIGKDLSQVSMPVTINEPLNMLQRLCEELEYSELLDAACDCKNPTERLALIAAFAVSAYASAAHRAASKPFNPLLGETYECVRQDKGFRFIAEQVSHHPPISVCHAESPRWSFWQEARIKTKFWGKSMEFQPAGRVHVRFHATGDHYTWNKVTTCVHNLFGGQRWVDQYGEMHITTDTKLNCKLNFIKASSWSASRHEVRGAIMDGAGRPLRLAGRWSEALYAGDPPAARCLWRPGAMPPEHELYYGFTRFAMELNELEPGMRDTLCPTDTRLRPDQRALEEGNVDTAERLKSQLEQAQRERRRDYPNHQPCWFRKGVEDTGEEMWVYGGEYWQARDGGFTWDSAPRIW